MNLIYEQEKETIFKGGDGVLQYHRFVWNPLILFLSARNNSARFDAIFNFIRGKYPKQAVCILSIGEGYYLVMDNVG